MSESSFSEEVAANVRAEVSRRGLTQQDLARLLGWSHGTVGVRWRGNRQWQLDDLEAVARVLGVTVARLVATVRYRLGQATVTKRYQSPSVADLGGLVIWTGR